jgi:DNA-binding transcriptional MerR regulator
MQEFTIRDIERMSGIKAHTIRVWESRYGIALPHRKKSKHRYYTNDDLKKVLRIAWLYHQGYRVSYIASLTDEAVSALIDEAVRGGQFYANQIADLLEASREMDDDAIERVLGSTVLTLGIERAMAHVIYPVLERIGLRWMNDEINPAQEHFASYHFRNMLVRHIDALPRNSAASPGTILVFAPEEEHHEIPLLFIHYLLRKNGYSVAYLGANVPLHIVEEFCEKRPIVQLHFHLLTNFTHYTAEEYLDLLSSRYPKKEVVMSGPLSAQIALPAPNALTIGSFDALVHYCRQPFRQRVE